MPEEDFSRYSKELFSEELSEMLFVDFLEFRALRSVSFSIIFSEESNSSSPEVESAVILRVFGSFANSDSTWTTFPSERSWVAERFRKRRLDQQMGRIFILELERLRLWLAVD